MGNKLPKVQAKDLSDDGDVPKPKEQIPDWKKQFHQKGPTECTDEQYWRANTVVGAAVGCIAVGWLLVPRLVRPRDPNAPASALQWLLSPRYRLVLVVRGDYPAWNRAQLLQHCDSASTLACERSRQRTPIALLFWKALGRPKLILESAQKRQAGQELQRLFQEASRKGICASVVQERTAVQNSGEDVVVALGPAPVRLIDPITKGLSELK